MLAPGSGFSTAMGKVPGAAAVPVAVSCVEETKVVGSGELLKRTCAPLRKLAPVTVRENAPRLVEAGEMPERLGVGFQSVTAEEEDLVESAEEVAVMVTVLGEGREAGAVNLPEESMVPRVALPLATELTDQVTEVLLAPVTVAEKVSVEPARMLAVVGATATVTESGGGGFCFCPEEVELLQEASARARRPTNTNRNRGRSAEDIVRIVCGGGWDGGNWTVGQKRGRGGGEEGG